MSTHFFTFGEYLVVKCSTFLMSIYLHLNTFYYYILNLSNYFCVTYQHVGTIKIFGGFPFYSGSVFTAVCWNWNLYQPLLISTSLIHKNSFNNKTRKVNEHHNPTSVTRVIRYWKIYLTKKIKKKTIYICDSNRKEDSVLDIKCS